MANISSLQAARKGAERNNFSEEAGKMVNGLVQAMEKQAKTGCLFEEVEGFLSRELSALGRELLGIFLAKSEEEKRKTLQPVEEHGGKWFRLRPAQSRQLLTWFGTVSYERSYLREIVPRGAKARGFYPLDAELGLLSDRFSPKVLSLSAELATRISYEEAREVLRHFLPRVPSTEVIQKSVLGYGQHTQEWFAQLQPPEDDGEVLVIQIDSKGIPTATDEELKKRRGRRSNKAKAASPRHRGRDKRKRLGKRPRLKKGDKSKNARMGTMVVMYTLREKDGLLLGPINKRVYASFASKKQAVQYARREATRRGFPPGTSKVVQVVTDGDRHLNEQYIPEYFPDALHTIDIMHVIERLWDAGASLYKEGSDECRKWATLQRKRLYGGRVKQIIAELKRCLKRTAKTGPGNKYRRDKLGAALRYIEQRSHLMNYDVLTKRDLEIGTGPVEGAIKHIMHKRMDHGGMRWIKERAEALLQLRCINVNGDWSDFTNWVHQRYRRQALETMTAPRLQKSTPAALPELLAA